jgi:hypothetical protein
MMIGQRQAWTSKPAWLALLFCALLLRTFIPAGYMIGASSAGGAALVLCPDGGTIPVAHHGHHKPSPAHHREAPCPYGALAAPVVPPVPIVLAPAPVLPPLQPAAFAAASLVPALAAPPPPSTGPPVLA